MTDRQNNRIKNFLGFTLVETVFVIAIIGILLAIVLPVVSSMRDKTRKLQDVANLKRIADAHKTYCEKFGGTDSELWLRLAGLDRTEKDASLINDPHAYISSGDKYASPVIKETICYYGSNPYNTNDKTIKFRSNNPYESDTTAIKLTGGEDGDGMLLSYCTISRLNLNMPQDTTPVAFTRGLMTNGKWHETYGLYGSSGGYVVYLDGHVTWFDGSKPAKFLKYDKSGWTSDIREAVPGNGDWDDGERKYSAIILCGLYLKGQYDGFPPGFTDTEGNILLLAHCGTGGW